MTTLRPLDPSLADARVEMGLARAEVAANAANRATAEQWWAIAQVLDEARRSPEVYVDPLLPMSDAERVDFAVRAAAADLAVRLGLAETTVRTQGYLWDTLTTRLPRLWSLFVDGEVPVPNARFAVELLASLPDEVVPDYDAAVAEIARLSPPRFRARARVLRERLHSVPLAECARVASATRGVWIENGVDGMAELLLRMPAENVHSAYALVDRLARELARVPGESRTLAQLRADVAADLLTSAGAARGTPRLPVGVLVPVMTLLGHSDEPGTLEGYGPIDAETARRLAAHAPSFSRLLTHPITGDLIGVDRGTYRPPADLKRWMEVVDETCAFPGCGRLARDADLDHTIDRQFGGATRAGNLAHLCRSHHRLKHMTRWGVGHSPPGSPSRLTWTSPTGFIRGSDPPPF